MYILAAAVCSEIPGDSNGKKSIRRKIAPDARVITSDEFLQQTEKKAQEMQKKAEKKGHRNN